MSGAGGSCVWCSVHPPGVRPCKPYRSKTHSSKTLSIFSPCGSLALWVTSWTNVALNLRLGVLSIMVPHHSCAGSAIAMLETHGNSLTRRFDRTNVTCPFGTWRYQRGSWGYRYRTISPVLVMMRLQRRVSGPTCFVTILICWQINLWNTAAVWAFQESAES